MEEAGRHLIVVSNNIQAYAATTPPLGKGPTGRNKVKIHDGDSGQPGFSTTHKSSSAHLLACYRSSQFPLTNPRLKSQYWMPWQTFDPAPEANIHLQHRDFFGPSPPYTPLLQLTSIPGNEKSDSRCSMGYGYGNPHDQLSPPISNRNRFNPNIQCVSRPVPPMFPVPQFRPIVTSLSDRDSDNLLPHDQEYYSGQMVASDPESKFSRT